MATINNAWTPLGQVIPNTAHAWSNPNVIYDTNPLILTGETNVLKMWCSNNASGGGTGIWYFESADGETWSGPLNDAPVIGGDVNLGRVFKVGDTYYGYVTPNGSPGANIEAWTSPDGANWT